MKTIDDVIQELEYIMESDPRTFSNSDCKYEWVFHGINEAIKMLKEIEKDLPSSKSAAVQMAYYKGLNDGIEKCTERLKRLNDEEK